MLKRNRTFSLKLNPDLKELEIINEFGFKLKGKKYCLQAVTFDITHVRYCDQCVLATDKITVSHLEVCLQVAGKHCDARPVSIKDKQFKQFVYKEYE